jgi:hypothetical protein
VKEITNKYDENPVEPNLKEIEKNKQGGFDGSLWRLTSGEYKFKKNRLGRADDRILPSRKNSNNTGSGAFENTVWPEPLTTMEENFLTHMTEVVKNSNNSSQLVLKSLSKENCQFLKSRFLVKHRSRSYGTPKIGPDRGQTPPPIETSGQNFMKYEQRFCNYADHPPAPSLGFSNHRAVTERYLKSSGQPTPRLLIDRD